MIAVSRGNNAVSYGVHNIHNAVNCIRRTTGIILCLRREDVPGNAITQYVML